MQKLILSVLAFLFSIGSFGQNTYKAVIKEKENNEIMPGTTVYLAGTTNGTIADENGYIELRNIPDGEQIIIFRFVGYEEINKKVIFPRSINDTVLIFLVLNSDEEEEVQITSTRSTRSIKDIPTRVEFIAGEELGEKGNMKPGDIRMVLNESTGIQTQQTSATSANASIRIQGLDGRYTQLLKDGFPLYSGASGGLGLLQIPPLDLKQVEVIKGSASTLYGGGAIAGLVNLVSKTPAKEKELQFLINGTSAKGLDISGFYSNRFKKTGTTIYLAHNSNEAYDPANIDLTAIPKFRRLTINPKLFLYPSSKTEIHFGINSTFENRIGGDMHYIEGNKDSLHSYFESNKTQRISSQLSVEKKTGECGHINFKNSFSYFNRILETPGNVFNGTQYATFSELNYSNHTEKSEWIGGFNLWTDRFNEKPSDTFPVRNYIQNTLSAFVQNSWKGKKRINLESGLRADYVAGYGFVLLPRISALIKINTRLTSRIGGGLGYKTPTIFTEESERIQYRGVMAIDEKSNGLEKSYGGNWDFNYRVSLAENKIHITLNHLFYYTYLNHPLILTPLVNATSKFININGYTESKGTETNIKIGYNNFKLFLGYTFTDAKTEENGIREDAVLTAKHRVNAVLIYEVKDKLKLGLESYYFSKQKLSDGNKGKEFILFGFMAEKLWNNFSVYINFENFSDVRQTRFGSIYTGTLSQPAFKEIYAPLDGFVINGGIKIKL